MRENEISLAHISMCKDRIYYSVLLQENTRQQRSNYRLKFTSQYAKRSEAFSPS